jgi:hypothetical protein
VTDDTTGASVSFALRGARDVAPDLEGGVAIYRAAYAGADVVHRPHAEGTEDFVAFAARPEREELVYEIDLANVAGLRLVAGVLEMLTGDGTPVLRVARPSVVESSGRSAAAELTVEGCAVDTDPRAPWGRPVTRPGQGRCVVRVAWQGIAYPAIVDPAWTSTGSMSDARRYHTATLLSTGYVLVAGGFFDAPLSSVDLYNPAGTGTFAATGRSQPPAG